MPYWEKPIVDETYDALVQRLRRAEIDQIRRIDTPGRQPLARGAGLAGRAAHGGDRACSQREARREVSGDLST